MDSSIEIRKLQPSHVRELAQILDYGESWKRLMSIIPKNLERDNYVCDVKINNPPKFHSEHFKIIENGSAKYKRSCTEILFDEWGTMGKIRPTLGHLKYLLTKAELFRAADYVSVELLHQEPPQRPTFGPAALVTTDLTDIKKALNGLDKIEHIEESSKEDLSYVNNMPPPQSIVPNVVTPNHIIPNIIISEVSETTGVYDIPIVKMNEVSDMMKFSSAANNSDEIIPEISSLLRTSGAEENSNLQSGSSKYSSDTIHSQEDNKSVSRVENNSFIPPISELLENDTETSTNIPALSDLIPNSDVIPNFEMLQTGEEHSRNASSSYITTKCPSPLPNLSLNTELPHFTYSELAAATNNFNEEPYTCDNNAGRFLGSGAFGSVFLAPKLIGRPVAVKKIFLDNTDSVNEEDAVTKQFRNEVEVLCKYKHENLVSLLGYSCDGCTYCLVYEYVSGGALKDRLQDPKRKLLWKDRLNIALGTANAVSYLHTAFDTSLIHRDIKTANILLDFENKAKLCDFGLVKLLPSQKTNTHTAAYGTSAYMSPEAHRGDISVKLDTFSFGVVLLELLTSLAPIDYNRQGYDIVTHVEDHCENDITTLLDTSVGTWQENGINYGQKLYELAQKCLEEKKKRPSMVEVRTVLTDLVIK